MVGINGERDGDDWDSLGEDRLETAQLELNDPSDRLPWLESADDDLDDGDGYDTSRLILVFLGGLALVLAAVGGIWWFSNRATDAELVADGSLVAAPAEPYKAAPLDPGGKTFAGTGDLSYTASEGRTRPPALAGSAEDGTPVAAPVPTAAPSAAAAAPATPAPALSGVGVQVGAFSSKASADAGWAKLVAQSDGVLSGVSHRVVAGTADNGTIFRLQAVAPDRASASALCSRLKGAGISCQVK